MSNANIMERLSELMTQRGIEHYVHTQPNNPLVNWYIVYKYKGVTKEIFPASRVCDQHWLEEPVIETPKNHFPTWDEWYEELKELFNDEFGMYPDDFEDYNWRDEYDSEVPADDAFEEWKAITRNGTEAVTGL